MPFLNIKDFFLYPVRFLDGVECGDDLLALFTAQTLAHLFVVLAVELRPFIKNDTLIVGDTLNLLRVIKTTEINLGSIRYADNLPDSILEFEQAEDAECLAATLKSSYMVLLIDAPTLRMTIVFSPSHRVIMRINCATL